jgi:hypothetical protein
VIAPPESQRPVRPCAGVGDADAGASGDPRRVRVGGDVQLPAREILAIVSTIEAEREGQLAWPAADRWIVWKPDQRRDRSYQHRLAVTGRPGHDVEHLMDAVAQVHVADAAGAEHHRRASGRAEPGVAREVVGPDVGLGLDDHPGAAAVDERAADQPARDGNGIAREEALRQARRRQRFDHQAIVAGRPLVTRGPPAGRRAVRRFRTSGSEIPRRRAGCHGIRGPGCDIMPA